MLLGGNFLLVFILYAISIAVVFSNIGEKVLKFFERVRSIETKREHEYLTPLFDEVYENAKRHYPHLGKIEICVIDKMTVNACALGTSTIAVTKGAIETFNEEELKAIIAHEIAHILYLDTIAILYALVGNGLFTALVLANKLILILIEKVDTAIGKSFFGLMVGITRIFFEAGIFLFMLIMNFAIAINSRKNEFRADHYACWIGYGHEMVEALYLLEKISLGDNSNTISRLTASHPRITARIQRLEAMYFDE
jgi:heat shock protein HtpX